MRYHYYVKCTSRMDKNFKKLSLTTKAPIGKYLMMDYAYNYGTDHQVNPNTVIIECRDDDGKLIEQYNPNPR